jgi:uncharacterized protein (DUF885 family)
MRENGCMSLRLFFACFFLVFPVAATGEPLDDLASDFWKWRAMTQPVSGDDIPRIERPDGFVPRWSSDTIPERLSRLVSFERRWKAIPPPADLSRLVDYRLIGSALARVRFELEVEKGWKRNPGFYIDQTLGSYFEALLQPPPFTERRSRILIARLTAIPATLEHGKENLTEMAWPFAKLAANRLFEVRRKLRESSQALTPLLAPAQQARFQKEAERAGDALESFRAWISERAESLPRSTAVGRDAYLFFLQNVALMPFTPEQLLDMGRQEWERTVAFETYEQQRNQGKPALALFKTQADQIAREAREELAVRKFLVDRGILSVPSSMGHYRNLPLPRYIEALGGGLGVTDDLTGPSRLKEDGVSYIRVPSPNLGYFSLSTARDPRPILVHEGTPGHYFQLCLSWAHENPIRRFYYDSGANEGIGFYAEEMMLQAGYFDDSPRTREIIYNFMRLRALRVEVDVRLALGTFTIEEAATYLQKTVPMDYATALQEAAMFAATPGQAISYQIGKLQIQSLLADARRVQGNKFNLRAFHDYVWKNGNVPVSLMRLEYLQDPRDVPKLPQ